MKCLYLFSCVAFYLRFNTVLILQISQYLLLSVICGYSITQNLRVYLKVNELNFSCIMHMFIISYSFRTLLNNMASENSFVLHNPSPTQLSLISHHSTNYALLGFSEPC